MKPTSPLEPVLAHVRAEPSRTWSIIISFFGDAIVPRGGSVWLGTLLAFFKGMQVGENVVRSAVSRLTAEEWLSRTKIGRHSYYHLAERGRETFARAARRIYHPPHQRWQNQFEAVMVEEAAPDCIAALLQAGYGAALPGLFIAPGGTLIPPLGQGAVTLKLGGTPEDLKKLAAKAWNLAELAVLYERFCEVFGPLQQALRRGVALSASEAMLARVLLIHEYRRIALRDPLLPAEILPRAWTGNQAQILCAEIYAQLLSPSERWLDENAQGEDAQPLPPNQEVYKRFTAVGLV